MITPPPAPRLFLVDGYALIYRAFFALISRPLTTSRGENTAAAWGVVNFLQRLLETHPPVFFSVIASTSRRDSHWTRMGLSTLKNFARGAKDGVSVLSSHKYVPAIRYHSKQFSRACVLIANVMPHMRHPSEGTDPISYGQRFCRTSDIGQALQLRIIRCHSDHRD